LVAIVDSEFEDITQVAVSALKEHTHPERNGAVLYPASLRQNNSCPFGTKALPVQFPGAMCSAPVHEHVLPTL